MEDKNAKQTSNSEDIINKAKDNNTKLPGKNQNSDKMLERFTSQEYEETRVIPGIKDELETARKTRSRRIKILSALVVIVLAFGSATAISYFNNKKEALPDKTVNSAPKSQETNSDLPGAPVEKDGSVPDNSGDKPIKQAPDMSEFNELVENFNTMPEGEEKEAVRERLEEILEYAEQQAPVVSN